MKIVNYPNLPGNKSMNMRLTLGTANTRLSPVLDTQRICNFNFK
jgi:hypothetical protein